jgi:hypothetical protein
MIDMKAEENSLSRCLERLDKFRRNTERVDDRYARMPPKNFDMPNAGESFRRLPDATR